MPRTCDSAASGRLVQNNRMIEDVPIQSHDYWFKVIEMLQQNWALIDPDGTGVIVYFIGDTSGVFDEMRFPSQEIAQQALQRNGFRRFANDDRASSFLRCPEPPFTRRPHPNGPIYSSGRFWKTACTLTAANPASSTLRDTLPPKLLGGELSVAQLQN